ncbi:MAG: hypothetical protein SGARI_000825 [Bacillariaceae sp.]
MDTGTPEDGVIVTHPGLGMANNPGVFVGPAITSFGPVMNGNFADADLYSNGVVRIQVIFDDNNTGKKSKSAKRDRQRNLRNQPKRSLKKGV